MKSSLPSKRAGNTRKSASESSPLMSYLVIFGVCGYLLLVGLTSIYLQQKTEDLGAEWDQANNQLEAIRKQNSNKTLEREKFMQGSYILPHARQMGLRPPFPGQVRQMARTTPDRRNQLIAKDKDEKIVQDE